MFSQVVATTVRRHGTYEFNEKTTKLTIGVDVGASSESASRFLSVFVEAFDGVIIQNQSIGTNGVGDLGLDANILSCNVGTERRQK